MKLVVFDMDGTLTDAFAIEENCYVLAIEQALDLANVRTDWASYPHTTASYCLEAIVRAARGHPPTREESRAVQARMIEIMDGITQRTGRKTAEIPGAAAGVRELLRQGYAVAIASGDWEETARHKMSSAGIPFEDLPAVYCEAAHARAEIMRTAHLRAASHYGCTAFDRIVYVGDAAWDVRACRELEWPLVGVAQDEHAARLRALGVTHIIPHYLDFVGFRLALEQASSPRPVA